MDWLFCTIIHIATTTTAAATTNSIIISTERASPSHSLRKCIKVHKSTGDSLQEHYLWNNKNSSQSNFMQVFSSERQRTLFLTIPLLPAQWGIKLTNCCFHREKNGSWHVRCGGDKPKEDESIL